MKSVNYSVCFGLLLWAPNGDENQLLVLTVREKVR